MQKKHRLIKWEGERERARAKIGRIESDTVSVESCSPSMACDMEEVYSESPRKMQDKEETTSEASWTAVTKGKGKQVWRLEPEGEAERPEATIPWNGVEGVSLNPECESRHWQVRAKTRGRKEKIKQTWKRW